jgi:hypothetical protein
MVVQKGELMPRSQYIPSVYRPIGIAYPLVNDSPKEDKPTVEIDVYARGLQEALIEAVTKALEIWNPVFWYWEDVPPTIQPDGTKMYNRQKAHFRPAHGDKILKFQEDIFGYMQRVPEEEWQNKHFVEIANKYVHIRPLPRAGDKPFPRHDVSYYVKDQVKAWVRRSDPEWDPVTVTLIQDALEEVLRTNNTVAYLEMHNYVGEILEKFDLSHRSYLFEAYGAEVEKLLRDQAHIWEHLRLVAFYVQDVFDARPEKEFESYEREPNTNARQTNSPDLTLDQARLLTALRQ